MAQIIQPGFTQVSGPWDYGAQALASGISSGFDRAYTQAQTNKQNAIDRDLAAKQNKFAIVSDIISKNFPDERGGLTAAYRSGNAGLAAAADQALGLYLNSIEGVTGKPLSAQEREALKAAFVNGQLTTKQLVANARAMVMSPQGTQGQAQVQTQPQGTQQPSPMTNVLPAQVQSAVTSPINIESLQPQGAQTSGVLGAVGATPQTQVKPQVATPTQVTPAQVPTQVSRATPQYAGVPIQAPPASPVSPNPYMERGFAPAQGSTPQGTYRPKTYTPDQQEANRQKILQILSFGLYKPTVTEATIRAQQSLQEQVQKVEKAKASGKNPFLTGEQIKFSPEEIEAVQDDVSKPTASGGRAFTTPTGSTMELSGSEVSNVSKAVKGVGGMMDKLLKARNADELGAQAASVTKALESASALVPGAKEMDQDWAAATVRALISATPQELSALGLDTEAKNVLENDKNRLLAEQNSINLFSTLKRNAIDITQLEASKRIAELQYLGSVSASTGTQQGLLTKQLTDVAVAMVNAAAGSKGGKELTGTQFAKFWKDAGFETFADFVSGMFGGEGSVYQAASGLPFRRTKKGFRAPMPEEMTEAGATPGATYGRMASGLLVPQEAESQSSGATSQINQSFGTGNVEEMYRQNAQKAFAEWQQYLASQQ